MARDIAFVADKDTRDEIELVSEPLPQHDYSRSEGGPATAPPATEPSDPVMAAPVARIAEREPLRTEPPEGEPTRAEPAAETLEPAAPAPAEPSPAPGIQEAGKALETDEESPPAPANSDIEPALAEPEPALPQSTLAASDEREPAPEAEFEAEPEPGTLHAATSPQPDAWHAAIADALSTPPKPEPEPKPEPPLAATEPAPAEDPVPQPPNEATAEALPQGSDAPSPSPSAIGPITAALAAAATHRVAPPPATEQPASDTAFTSAVEGLFRPPETTEDPHLITIGRRLDPARRIPRPTAPVLPTRADTLDYGEALPRPVTWKTGTWKDRLRIAGRYAAYAVGGYLALVLALIVVFRFVNPPGSMLMLTQLLTGTAINRTWAPFESISPTLVRAVIVSEDSRFCEHSGIDTAAMREAIERATRGTPRGASTISMQVTKNLFLFNAKSYLRKVVEIPLTLVMELVWPKRRVLEMYLNIAEWGPGVFGAEAAARHHFGKPASALNEREAALLAAVLPNPLLRVAGAPGPATSRKARVIQARVKAYGTVASCVVSPSSQPASAAPAALPSAKSKAPLVKPKPRPKPQTGQKSNDWTPTLQFGPQ